MPSKLSPLEPPIAARLRQWRRWAGWSQHELAASLGCQRDLLAAYEAGRAAVPWPLVQRLALTHRVNPEWLYSGAGEPEASFDLADALTSEFPAKMRFSEAWRQVRERAGHRMTEHALATAVARFASAGRDLKRAVAELVSGPPEQALDEENLTRHGATLTQTLEQAHATLAQLERHSITPAKHPRHRRKTVAPSPRPDQPPTPSPSYTSITKSPVSDSPTGIPAHEWDRLLARIRAATSAPGARSTLARQLGVSRQNVTAWLQGAKHPNAVSTLRLAKLFPEPSPESPPPASPSDQNPPASPRGKG